MELHADTPFNPLSMRICTLAIHAYSEFFGTNIWLPLTWKGRAIEGFLTGNPVCQACGGKEMTEECSWLGCSIAPLGKPTGSTECSECGNPICDGLCPRCDRHSLGCDYSKPYGNGGHLCSTCAEDELRRYNLDCAADKAAEAMDKVPYDEPVFVKYSPRGFANEWDILAFSSHAQYSFFVRGLDPAKSNWTELSRKQAEDMLANAEVHWAEERDGLCTTTLYGGNLIVQP
jgi:hypothetical protein